MTMNMKSTAKSFAASTGQSANSNKGSFSGALLGKLAEGLDALDAMANLAAGKFNRFMELAIKAAHVAKKTLEATKTIPFATADLEFNAALNPAARVKAPSLGLGSGAKAKPAKKHKDE